MNTERFWSRVDKSGECWIWQGAPNHAGYGRFNQQMAHRVAYEINVGPIPDGLTIDHLCKTRNCVNPAHMEPVTLAENVRRAERHTNGNDLKTECVHGHAFTAANTATHNGKRKCKTCARDRARIAYRVKAGLL